MGLINSEEFMERICTHCDSHIEMCGECLFKNIIDDIEIKRDGIPKLQKVVAIKTNITNMPEYCEECRWYGSRPHPYKGWTDLCELMCQCMDDDQPEEWIYNGNGRPKSCPLVEITDCRKEHNDE